MTIKDFYEWAIINGVENLEIKIGNYGNSTFIDYDDLEEQNIDIDFNRKIVKI